jgi:hypothetical protein
MAIILPAIALNMLVAVFQPTAFGSVLATLLFAALIFRLFARTPYDLVLLLPVMIPRISSLLSLNMIDFGAHMPEIGRYGYVTAATALYAFYNAVLVWVAFMLLERWRKNDPERGAAPWQRSAIVDDVIPVCVGAMLTAYLFLVGYRVGFPLMTGTDRFVFRVQTADIITVNILNLKVIIAIALGMVFASTRSAMIRNVIALEAMALVVLFFLFGDKFFTVAAFAAAFAGPYFVLKPRQARRAVVLLAPMVAIGVVLMLLINLYIFSGYGAGSMDAGMTRLMDRMAAQGQLWFVYVANEGALFHLDMDMMLINFKSIFASNTDNFDFANGLSTFYFANRYSPQAFLHSMYTNAGTTTLTGAFEAYSAVMTGYAGLFFVMILTGVLVAAMCRYLYRAILSGSAGQVLAPAAILAQALYMLNQGTIDSLLSWASFKIVAAFWLLGAMERLARTSLGSLPAQGRRIRHEWLRRQ